MTKNQNPKTQHEKFNEAKLSYINAWNSHAIDFGALAFCSDEKLSQEVTDCINKLKELIPKIANTKTSFNGIKDEVY